MISDPKGDELRVALAPAVHDPRVMQVIRFLRAQSDQVWLVGGWVRDMLVGRTTHDMDVLVPQQAVRRARAIADHFGGAFFPLDVERDIGRALLGADGDKLVVDISSLPEGGLEADLGQRDFTINAMALDVSDEPAKLIDRHEGWRDLQAQQVRAIAESCFRDDPLRTLRAVRISIDLGFDLEPHTARWLRRDGRLLSDVARERVRDEMVRILAAPGAKRHIALLDQLGLLDVVLPEVADLKDVGQSAPHYLDVYSHTLETLRALEWLYGVLTLGGDDSTGTQEEGGGARTVCVWDIAAETLVPVLQDNRTDLAQHLAVRTSAERSRRTLLKWAVLFHDLGKPKTRTVEPDGRVRFLGHESLGAKLASDVLRRLRFAKTEERFVETVVRHHLRPAMLAREPRLTGRAIYRYFRDTGDAGVEICLLALADHLATWGQGLIRERWESRVDTVAQLLRAYFDQNRSLVAPEPLLSGTDLQRELGLSEGPLIGRLLENLREAQAAGEVRSRDQAVSLARELSAEE